MWAALVVKYLWVRLWEVRGLRRLCSSKDDWLREQGRGQGMFLVKFTRKAAQRDSEATKVESMATT